MKWSDSQHIERSPIKNVFHGPHINLHTTAELVTQYLRYHRLVKGAKYLLKMVP